MREVSATVGRYQRLIEGHSPARLLIDERLEVLHVSGDPAPYLGQPRIEPGAPLPALRDGPLAPALRSAIAQARRTGVSCATCARLADATGAATAVRIEVTPVAEADQALLLISIGPDAVAAAPAHAARSPAGRVQAKPQGTWPPSPTDTPDWEAGLLDCAAPMLARDLDDRLVYWNRAAEALYGWRQDQALGRVVHELLVTRFPEPLPQIRQLLDARGTWRGELLQTRADGSTLDVDALWTPLRDDTGAIAAIVETHLDAGERTCRERTLADKARQLDAIFRNARVGITLSDLPTITWSNPRTCEILGYTEDELIGQTSRLFFSSDETYDRSMGEVMHRLLAGDSPVHEDRLIRKDGQPVWIRATLSAVDPQASPLQVIGIIEDISALKRLETLAEDVRNTLEQRVAERTAELAGANRRLAANQLAMDRAGFSTLWTDEHGRFVHVNQVAADQLGYSIDELLTMSVPDIDPNFSLEQVQQIVDTLLEPRTLRFESEQRHRDGHGIPVEVTLCPVEGATPAAATIVAIVQNITARKQTEAELEQYRRDLEGLVQARTAELAEAIARLETATEAAGLGVWEWHLEDGRTTWDARTFAIFGVPEAERHAPLDLASWLDRVHPEDRAGSEARIPGDIAGGGRFSHQHRIIRADGAVRHVLATGQVLRDGSGRPRRLVGFLQDITETKEVELALRRSEQRLEGILYGTDAGTWEWEPQTGSVVLNTRWAAMLGYTLAELAPHCVDTWRRLIHPDDLGEAELRLSSCLSGESPFYECELRMRHRAGYWLWVFEKGRVVDWGPDGSPWRLAGIQLDISDQKLAERALATQQERFRRFFEDNGSVMVMIDPDSGRIEAANKAAVRFYGYPLERLIGLHMDAINTLRPEELARRHREVAANSLSSFSAPHRLASGEVRQVRIHSSPITVGPRTLLFSIIHDETARVQAETELRKAKEAAEAAAQAKGQFLAQMSHEIRTPMNGILGLAELALHRPLEPLAREYLEKLYRSGVDLLGILNDILDQSRIESGKLALHNAPFPVEGLLGALRDLFAEGAAEKGLAVRLHAAENVPPSVVGDALRLRQVLSNLIGNAIKFTEHGEVRLEVSCLEERDGLARLRWSVTDTGPGLDARSQTLLFEAFAQGDQSISRRYGGTGLGLSISRGLTELMGGALTLQSTPGVGSTFSVELRLPVAAAVPLPDTVCDPPGDLAGARVLVAEDNPVNRQVLADMLGLLGVQATLAASGREALDALAREMFDAVLMDIQMPEMDGLTATARIRAHPAWSGLPVIAITAGVTQAERDRIAASGADDLLAKPVTLVTLQASLQRWLTTRTAAGISRPKTGGRVPPTPETAAADTPLALAGFDLAALTKAMRPERVLELLQMFADNAREETDAIDRALASGNPAAARKAMHSLKGACAIMGAEALQAALGALSEALEQGAPTDSAWTRVQCARTDALAQIEALLPPAPPPGD